MRPTQAVIPTRARFASEAIRWIEVVALTALLATEIGCAKKATVLVSAPNLYADDPSSKPFADVPPEWQTSTATIIYATDRQPETVDGVYGYGIERSRETRFGLATVQMGSPRTTWEQLVQASTQHERKGEFPLALTSIDERGHYPEVGPAVEIDGKWVDDPAYIDERDRATEQLHKMLAEQLAKTPRKEVYLFVHGYANTFESGTFRTSQIWHFLGRGGVGVLFSWPAGSSGLLRGYTRDRESGEFANPHLKQIIRDIASCPEVQRLNLIAHSRGTGVLATALRELHIGFAEAGKNTRDELKVGQVVLAAPDIDLDVFIERWSADRAAFAAHGLTIYTSANDKAIGLSEWLFGGLQRLGQLSLKKVGRDITVNKTHPVLTIVDMRGKTIKKGHGYFLDSPACLSDFILVLRDGRRPGAANGRPLYDEPGGFWELHDGYPSAASATPTK